MFRTQSEKNYFVGVQYSWRAKLHENRSPIRRESALEVAGMEGATVDLLVKPTKDANFGRAESFEPAIK